MRSRRRNALDPRYQGISRHLRARIEQAHARWELLDTQTDKLYEQGRIDEAMEVEVEAAIALEHLDAMLDEVEEAEDRLEDADNTERSGFAGGAGSEMPGEAAEDPNDYDFGLRTFIQALIRESVYAPRFADQESFLDVPSGRSVTERVQRDMSRAQAEREGYELVAPADIPKWQWDGTYYPHRHKSVGNRGFPTEPGDPRGTGLSAIVTVWVPEEHTEYTRAPSFLDAFKARVRSYSRDLKAFDKAKPLDVWEACVEVWYDHLRRRHSPATIRMGIDMLANTVLAYKGGREVMAAVDRLYGRSRSNRAYWATVGFWG